MQRQPLKEWLEGNALQSWGPLDRERLARQFGYRVEENEALSSVCRRVAVIFQTQ
jgi:hypothetical protein